MPESSEHEGIKKLLEARLKEWFGLSITEYPSSGHELDVFGVTSDGLKIYIEVIWTHTAAQFHKDMSMLQQSDAHVKLVACSPAILNDVAMVREFTKVAVSETEKSYCIHPDLLDGEKILSDHDYVNQDLKGILTSLVDKASKKISQEKTIPKPYFEKRLEAILVPMIDDGGGPIVQMLVGPIAKQEECLQVSQGNAHLFECYTPAFLRISKVTPRRDRYEFDSHSSSIHLEVYPDGCFHTYFPIDSEEKVVKLDSIVYAVSSFSLFAARILKMKNVIGKQKIYLELCKLRDFGVVVSPFFASRLDWHYFPRNKQRNIFVSEFDPSQNWRHMFSILCNIYREICKELGLVDLSEQTIRDKMKKIISEDVDLWTQYSGTGVTIPRINSTEIFE